MKFEISQNDSQTVLTLIGEVIASDKGQFADIISKTVDPNQNILIDFKQLEFMDSAGLGFLLSLWQQTNEKQLDVTITNATGEVKELLELSDFHILFSFE